MQTLSPAPNDWTSCPRSCCLNCVELAVALGTGVALRLTVAANRQSSRCLVEYAGVGPNHHQRRFADSQPFCCALP
jgi:hypothetical protein